MPLKAGDKLGPREILASIVSDREVAEIDLRRDKFHCDWNYTVHPRS